MKAFVKPSVYSILKGSENFFFLQAQATGGNIPTDPDLDCGAACCNFDQNGGDSADFVITWNDDPGTDVGNYSVSVNLQGSGFVLTDATSGCDITESPAGTYTLECDDTTFSGFSCSCDNTEVLEVVAINDGVNNLDVNIATCELQPCNGC